MMRIGYLTYGLDRAPAGIGRYVIELLRALAKLPDSPQVVLLTTEREDRHGLWALFEHHSLPGCRLLPGLMTVGNIVLSLAARRYKLDVIHDPNGIAPFLGPRGSVRRLVTIHDAFAYVHPEAHNRLDNWRYRFMLPHAIRQADVVLTVSHHSCQDLQHYLSVPGGKIQVIHSGIASRFVPVPDGYARQAVLAGYGLQGPYLLYLGGINARKNIGRLLQAFARVRERHPDVVLVIGGQRQWQTSEMDASLRRLHLAEHVRFTGYVDDADLPALYSAAAVFVFPSLYEGFGLPPLEAMACGTPVVTSHISSLPEVVGDAALTTDPYDVDGLSAAIEQALTDEVLRTELRQRGIARAALFTWDRAARKTRAVYEQLLGQAADSRSVPALPLKNEQGHGR